jgi:polyisoprenoid-binding protein YceI
MTEQSGQMTDLSQFAGDWVLDGSRSSVSFRSSSLWGLVKVKGKFTGLHGEAHVDPSGTVRGRLVIDASTVDTGHKKRDRHLRSDDFFAVARYAEIVFELGGLEPGPDKYRLSGTLRVIGNSQPLELVAQVRDRDASGLSLHAQTSVDRSLWGVAFRKNGMVNMSTALEISARFDRQG